MPCQSREAVEEEVSKPLQEPLATSAARPTRPSCSGDLVTSEQHGGAPVGKHRFGRFDDSAITGPPTQAFEERHYPVSFWARLWGFSEKTVREWFRDERGAGILRQQNTGRRSKRDYTTIMISAGAAARVYMKRSKSELIY
jgi:hypothetical protein